MSRTPPAAGHGAQDRDSQRCRVQVRLVLQPQPQAEAAQAEAKASTKSAARGHIELKLINGYGPTENTTFTCCHTIGHRDALSESIPIGKPIANTEVYILDEQMNPVPPGQPGELYAIDMPQPPARVLEYLASLAEAGVNTRSIGVKLAAIT